MALGTAFISKPIVTNFVPELWSDEILDILQNNLVMAKLVNIDFSDMVKGKGDTIHIPKISALSAYAKAARSPVTVQSPSTESTVDITIDQHYEVSFMVEDLAEIQTSVNLRNIYTGGAGYALAKNLDDALITEAEADFDIIDSTSDAGTSFLAEDDILLAKTLLDENDCPLTDRHIVIAPQQYNKLLAIARFSQYDAQGANAAGVIPAGALGTIHGFTVWMTQQLQATGTATTDTCNTLFFHRNSLALCVQLAPRVQANYLPDYLGWLVTIDTVYGLQTLRSEWGIIVQTDAVSYTVV